MERAMSVMVWFYEHRGALGPLMDGCKETDESDKEENWTLEV